MVITRAVIAARTVITANPANPGDRAKTIAEQVRNVLMDHYHGPLPDDDTGHRRAELMVRYLVAQPLDGVSEAEHFLALWCPWMPPAKRAQTVQRARRLPPPRFKADTLAQRLGVDYQIRQRLKLTQIGAIDVPKAERDRRRKDRDRYTVLQGSWRLRHAAEPSAAPALGSNPTLVDTQIGSNGRG